MQRESWGRGSEEGVFRYGGDYHLETRNLRVTGPNRAEGEGKKQRMARRDIW